MLGSPPHIRELSTVNLELFELIKKVDLQYLTILILCEPLLPLQVQINNWLSNSTHLGDSSFLAVSEKFFFVSFFLVSRKFVVDTGRDLNIDNFQSFGFSRRQRIR